MNERPLPTPSGRRYSDAPPLSSNLILGSLQLLFWILFHPSAWRNHIARIDPDLPPDFCLAELRREHWQNPILQRLLLIVFGIWPVLTGAIIGLTLWMGGASNVEIFYGISEGMAFGLSIGFALGLTVSLSIGLSAVVATSMAMGATAAAAEGIGLGLAVGIAFGLAESTRSRMTMYSPMRQIGGVVVGLISSVVAFGIAMVLATSIAYGLAFGVMEGIAVSLAAILRTRHWRRSVLYGVVYGILVGVSYSALKPTSEGLASGIVEGAIFSLLCALPYATTKSIVDPWAGAVAGALGGGGWIAIFAAVSNEVSVWPALPLGAAGILLGLSIGWWRPIALYPLIAAWNLWLYRAEERREASRPALLHLHSAFWDENQRWRLPGLEEHLLLVIARDPDEGQMAMDYLINGQQQWAIQAVQLELDARALEQCDGVQSIAQAHRALAAGELQNPGGALLRSFIRISSDVDAALHQESAYNQRLALSAVEDRVDGLLRELTRNTERYAVRFRPIAAQWRQTLADHGRALAETVEQRQEIDNPYVIGVPLTAQQEIFIGRTDISARIEQLLLDRRRPPLLLYGQRRMGKTSLLNNLGRLLPSTIVPLFVDLQGPASQAQNDAGFLYNIARGMIISAERQRGMTLPPPVYEELVTDPYTRFDEWLDKVEKVLGSATALLALDEFEVLDNAIGRGRFEAENVMGMLRHIIQHRPQFKVLLAGSHPLDEFKRWASYLINVQVVHIGYLKGEETRQLVTQPVKNFALRYEEDAVERVLALTNGHPALTQLLCYEIVTLKNEQPPATRRLARREDVDAAVPEALSHGSFFFADIEQNQVDEAGVAVLRQIAAQGESTCVAPQTLSTPVSCELATILKTLAQREIIEPIESAGEPYYRFKVELIRRWFAPHS
ncbi:MAG: ATP-binding protein [Anaerolineae bacterium]|nr:ATP-binding protein [Anaerolineae bacterium]